LIKIKLFKLKEGNEMKKMFVWMMSLIFALSISVIAFADEPGKSPAGKPMEIEPVKPKKTVEHEIKEAVDKHEKKEATKKTKKKAKKEVKKEEPKPEDKKDK
jgi:hypothetical protein